MKIILKAFVIFIIFSFELLCLEKTNIIGHWQCCDSIVSAAYLNMFEFNSDSTFRYLTSGYADDNPLESINGKYCVIEDTLFLEIEYLNYKDGTIDIGDVRNEDSYIFRFNYENVKKVKCTKDCKHIAIITKSKIISTYPVISINGFDFYKIEDLNEY